MRDWVAIGVRAPILGACKRRAPLACLIAFDFRRRSSAISLRQRRAIYPEGRNFLGLFTTSLGRAVRGFRFPNGSSLYRYPLGLAGFLVCEYKDDYHSQNH